MNCSPQKKIQNTRQEQASSVSQDVRIGEETHRIGQANTVTEISADEKVVTVIREYDTTKPVDENTGTPPLRRETMQTRQKAETAQQVRAEHQTEDTVTVTEEHAEAREESGTVTETEVRTGMNTLQKTFCGIGAFTVIALLAWIGVKLYKRFL